MHCNCIISYILSPTLWVLPDNWLLLKSNILIQEKRRAVWVLSLNITQLYPCKSYNTKKRFARGTLNELVIEVIENSIEFYWISKNMMRNEHKNSIRHRLTIEMWITIIRYIIYIYNFCTQRVSRAPLASSGVGVYVDYLKDSRYQ